MKNRAESDHAMLARLFFRLLPVQVAIVAMGSINCIVDGVVAGRFIDASTVGVIGLAKAVDQNLLGLSALTIRLAG